MKYSQATTKNKSETNTTTENTTTTNKGTPVGHEEANMSLNPKKKVRLAMEAKFRQMMADL